MSDTSIVEAKARLPGLVQRAEAGEPVHITRRGKRVAVILSEQEFHRLTGAPPKASGYLDFLADWRKRMQAEACDPLTDEEVASLRARDSGRDPLIGAPRRGPARGCESAEGWSGRAPGRGAPGRP